MIYERPYLSTYDQWEAPQEGTPPFRTMAKPVLAAVNGLCCGAGLDWVTTGDIVIASDKATFFDPHVSIGLVAGREMVRLARALPRNDRAADGADGQARADERASGPTTSGMITEVVEHDRLLERAHEIADIVNSQRAAGGARHAAGHPQDARPAAARGRDPRRDVPRAGACAPRTPQEGPLAFVEKRAPDWQCRDGRNPSRRSRSRPSCCEFDRTDRVATITLNRPGACSTRSTAPCARRCGPRGGIVKVDEAVNAVVLRAAGDRAFCAGLDIKKPLRPARRRLEPRGSRRAAQPEVAEGVEAGGVRGAGHVHGGRALLRQRGRHRHLLATDATFFDSHVSAGLVSALEPVGLMRKVGLGDTLRMALMGNDERVCADTALRIGLVTEVVAARCAVDRARTRSPRPSRPSHRRRPRARSRRSGSRSTSRTAPRWSRG